MGNLRSMGIRFKWLVFISLTIALAIWLLIHLAPRSTFFPLGYSRLLFGFLPMGLVFLLMGISSLYSVKIWLDDSPARLLGIVALTMFLVFLWPIACSMNTLLDFGAAREVMVYVNDKYVTSGKGRSCNLVMENPEIANGPRSLSVWASLYDSVQIGDRVILSTHSGAFGIPWFDGTWKLVEGMKNIPRECDRG